MLAIKYRKPADFLPYEKNPRTHDVASIKAVESSLMRFGRTTPVGVADGTLVYGHARRKAAMGLRDRSLATRDNDDQA